MKRCAKCGKEYEDVLDKCPACAKRTRRYVTIVIVLAVAVIALLKFIFIF